MLVAFGTESGVYDPAVYRFLVARILGRDVQRWPSDVVFTGWKSVLSQLPAFLRTAEQAGVGHALVAIDNDGGARRHPEHEPDHDEGVQVADEDGCRTCHLLHALPANWRAGALHRCVVVPVQTLETWLLCLRGDDLNAPSPEQYYGRRHMKRMFFGSPEPPEEERAKLAVELLKRPDALDVLRARRSFQFFERELSTW